MKEKSCLLLKMLGGLFLVIVAPLLFLSFGVVGINSLISIYN